MENKIKLLENECNRIEELYKSKISGYIDEHHLSRTEKGLQVSKEFRDKGAKEIFGFANDLIKNEINDKLIEEIKEVANNRVIEISLTLVHDTIPKSV